MGELSIAARSVPQIDLSKIPPEINAIIDVRGWASALLAKTEYVEPNPDFISTMIAFNVITSETVEDAFSQAGVGQLQKMLANRPGETTGPMEITDLYVASSDFETGNPCYVIVTATLLDTDEEIKFTTGATNVQATILALMRLGMWPIRCQVKRGDTKDKGGRYLLFVLPPD